MSKIKALNEGSSTLEDDQLNETPGQITVEAQEEQFYSKYSEALKFLNAGEQNEAKIIFIKLHEILKTQHRLKKLPSYNKLLFLCLKNLGLLHTDDINYFLDALEIDSEDISLWIKTGSRAFTFHHNYQLARRCYDVAYQLSPHNWIALDKLLDCYFILHDLYSCFKTCLEVLEKDQSYLKAQCLLYEVCRLHPPFRSDVPRKFSKFLHINGLKENNLEEILPPLRQLKLKRKEMFDEAVVQHEAKKPKISLNLESPCQTSLRSLGMKILKLYEKIRKEEIFVSTPIDIALNVPKTMSTDESASEDDREKPKVCNKNSGFPVEFLDKRRSSRVQRIQSKSRDSSDRSIFEVLLDLIPNSIKNRNLVFNNEPKQEEKIEEVEPEVVKKIFAKINLQQTQTKKVIRIYDLIQDYLYFTSKHSSSIAVPDVFLDLYKIHRKRNELPFAPFAIIGKDIVVDEIWCMLCANELNYEINEGIFLSQIRFVLKSAVDESKYKDFLVRTLVLRGTKECVVEYLEDALSLLQDGVSVIASNKIKITPSLVKSWQRSVSADSLNALLACKKYDDLIELLKEKPEVEITSNEENLLTEVLIQSKQWDTGIEIITMRSILKHEHLKTLELCLNTGKRGKLNHDLALKLIKMATTTNHTGPWTCLYWSLRAENEKEISQKTIVKFLKLGHQYLGKRGTCTSNDGEFLLLTLDYLLNYVSSNEDESIVQCFSCLFGHPSRKLVKAHMNSPQILLKWENAEVIYSYFVPESLPEFDSNRSNSIVSETEQLLSIIVPLVPFELNPKNYAKYISNYIDQGIPIADKVDKPEPQAITHNLYYFLADYYFKNKEFKKATAYYKWDLCLNPERFDSWAASALCRSSLLEQKLISGDHLAHDSVEKFYTLADATLRCYARALYLDPGNTKLWIEYGGLAYNIASHASRLKKTAIYYNTKTKQHMGYDVERLEIKRTEQLKIAKFCFDCANNTDSADEIWLHYYMLGKVAEKNNLLQAIEYFELADIHLYLKDALYPKKISYNNPPHLALETLEIHYRIHAATLKYLSLTQTISFNTLIKLKTILVRALRSPFAKHLTHSYPNLLDHDYANSALNSSSNSINKNMDTVSELVSDLIEIVSDKTMKKNEVELRTSLVELCLNAMKRCLTRFPAHYKSLYRLAYHYYTQCDVRSAQKVLLTSFNASISTPSFKTIVTPKEVHDSQPQDVLSKSISIPGLYAERKNNNLFNGIWRIPNNDIDRPGSFSACHMYRCTLLLIRVCTTMFDFHLLSTIAIQLNRTPDAGKKYLRDTDRIRLAREAYESCVSILKNQLMDSRVDLIVRRQILIETCKVADKFIKAGVFTQEASALVTYCTKSCKF